MCIRDRDRGSYHPITLVQRECERIFKSMGFTVEDYSEIVTDYECFESLNIPKPVSYTHLDVYKRQLFIIFYFRSDRRVVPKISFAYKYALIF